MDYFELMTAVTREYQKLMAATLEKVKNTEVTCSRCGEAVTYAQVKNGLAECLGHVYQAERNRFEPVNAGQPYVHTDCLELQNAEP